MGIFSTSTGYSSGLSIDMDNVVPALESANYTAMSLQIVAEAEANHNAIMKAIGIHELAAFEETGEEIIYESEAAGGFIAKVKQFFIKLWDKVKEIFHKFFAWLDSLTKDNKEFAKKYEAEARKRWSSLKDEFSIKGYKFTIKAPDYDEAEKRAIAKYASSVGVDTVLLTNPSSNTSVEKQTDPTQYNKRKEWNKAFSDKHSDAIEAVRAGVVSELIEKFNGSSLTAEEMTKELFEGYRDGDTSKITLEKSDINLEECISELKNYSNTKKEADKAFKDLKKRFDDTIKKCENLEKEANKLGTAGNEIKVKIDDKEISAAGEYISFYSHVTTAWKDVKEVLVSANGSYLQALKDRATQDKAVVAAVITTGKVKNESADYGYSYSESAGSMDFLAGVVLK